MSGKVSERARDMVHAYGDSRVAVERGEGWGTFGVPSDNRAALLNYIARLEAVAEAAREHQCMPNGEIQNENNERSCGTCDALAALDADK